MTKTVKLDWDKAKEIADVLTKTENPDEDYSITENALADKYNISLEDFHEIVDGIFRMIDFGISPLTQTPFVGISKGNMWLAKKDVNAALGLAPVSVSLLERAASLVGNPGTNISGSTDMACDEWQKDYERWRNER